jgi:sirohydrochlorin ferrochelatase
MSLGIVIVDHGSRSDESNHSLAELVDRFVRLYDERYPIVEPAHMELAEPSIGSAVGRCVARGADEIVVCPLFLGPGKHWQEDIPRLAAEAAETYAVRRHAVAAPLGIDELILKLLEKRIAEAVESCAAQHEEVIRIALS